MSEHQALIWKKLDHLGRMREYLLYPLAQFEKLMPVQKWASLQPDQRAARHPSRSA